MELQCKDYNASEVEKYLSAGLTMACSEEPESRQISGAYAQKGELDRGSILGADRIPFDVSAVQNTQQ